MAAMGALSERERRAMAAEKRFASADKKACEVCAKPLPPKSFEVSVFYNSLKILYFAYVFGVQRLSYKYCSVECVAKHRAMLDKMGVGSAQL